jgi:hypothetical protein
MYFIKRQPQCRFIPSFVEVLGRQSPTIQSQFKAATDAGKSQITTTTFLRSPEISGKKMKKITFQQKKMQQSICSQKPVAEYYTRAAQGSDIVQ